MATNDPCLSHQFEPGLYAESRDCCYSKHLTSKAELFHTLTLHIKTRWKPQRKEKEMSQ